jgi:hypothetical protein
MTDKLAHQALLEDKQTVAEINRREVAKRRWQEAENSDITEDNAGENP